MSFRRTTATLTAITAAAGLAVLVPAAPAGAAVSTSVVGNQITVSATGEQSVAFGCSGGKAQVNGASTSPAVACSALGKVTVNGDGGNQTVDARGLTAGTFPTLTAITETLGAGNDVLYASPIAETITMGTGLDSVQIDITGKADASISLGGDAGDAIYLVGTAGNDAVSVHSSGSNGTIEAKVGAAPMVQWDFSGVKNWVIDGKAGNDDLSTADLFVTDGVTMYGGPGDDKLSSGYGTADLFGGPGTNTFDGGQALDYIHSTSDTDVIDAGSGTNTIYDEESLRSGGRTIADAAGATDTYEVDLTRNDAVWRVRRNAVQGKADAVASLNRPGKQLLPGSVDTIHGRFAGATEPTDHTLADVHSLYGTKVVVDDGTRKTTVVDVTVGAGSWTVSGSLASGSATITPTAFGYDPIVLSNVGPASVHGAWTSKNRGFVHRSMRDLLFRFPTSQQLVDGQAKLDGSTTTRAAIVASLMGTDEYRGLDVDRTFVKYLRRKPDAGGRTYWIDSIRNGKALWRFRAQLFGSNEYFTKAGGTNAAYVVKAYNDVLGRDPDPSGKAYWTNKLDKGADRGAVALQFIGSAEARRRLVDDQFLRFLMRKPTANEQATWVDALPGATGEQDLIASLVSSTEYLNLS
ncbi:MAG: DUF4214 domain-containing protein [Acidimicrobiales bacterium]